MTTPVELSSGTDYTCPSDGYFRVVAPTVAGSYTLGYVSGVVLMRASAYTGYLYPPVMSIFVRKGSIIKMVNSTNGGSGSFYPLSD